MVVAPRMLVAAGLVCQALGARRGVILWSHGRSASDALAGTLKDSANFSYCNGLREGFGNKHDSSLISKQALDACRDRNQMLTHVMPVFLDKPGNALTTPKAFFRAARDRGFKVVVAVWRENVLARQVSSFELMVAHGRVSSRDAGAREHFCGGTLTQQIEDLTRAYRDGVNAARDAGLKVVERTFDEVVSDLCGTVAAVTDELEDEFRGSSCRPFESPHVLTSQRHKDLAGRTTPEAAACASKELRPSAYAWMLDLGRRHPPPRNASRSI